MSQQRRAEKDLRMAATVFEHSTSAILITDPAGYIVQAAVSIQPGAVHARRIEAQHGLASK